MFPIVTARPNITTQPISISIRAGDTNVTAMSCSAIGISPIYYQWEKYYSSNNSWINLAYSVVNVKSSNLKFNVITEEDEGVYHCIVTNDDGSIISDNATISVYSEFAIISYSYSMISYI